MAEATRRRSTGRDYARMLARLALFAAPLAAMVGLGVWFLAKTGELRCLDIERFADAQATARGELLYGPAYSDCTQQLKMAMTLRRRPEVLVAGTSRSMQLRSAFFRTSFYNAGGLSGRAEDLHDFLARIPDDAKPKLLLVVLDQFLVNEASDVEARKSYRPLDEALVTCPSTRSFVGEHWPRLYRDLLARKMPPSVIWSSPHPDGVGVRGQVLGLGFRADGSAIVAASDFSEVRDRMKHGVRRYEPGEHVAPRLVAAIEKLLDLARERGVDVVAILPPYAPTILDEMRAEGRWRYVDEVAPVLGAVFAARGFALYDYGDPRGVGLTDREFYDGFHGSERAYATILLDVAERHPGAREVIDVDGIRRLLSASDAPHFIVPPR